jgi:hypothetical protein
MSDLVALRFADVEFQIRQAEGQPAFFAFGVRKSGSSVMNQMVSALAKMNRVNYVDVAGQLFAKGVGVSAWQNDAAVGGLLHGGNLYGGFRNAPLGIVQHPLVRASRKVLLVRDPRDALVSEYFSNAYSHSIPKDGETRELMLAQRDAALRASVGDYVKCMAPALRETLREYAGFLDTPGMRLYLYEQAIMDKRWFLQDLCAHFGWTVSEVQLGQILGWADVRPDQENPTKFIRKVTPGDHREKLDQATIESLNEIFAEELLRFGYAR